MALAMVIAVVPMTLSYADSCGNAHSRSAVVATEIASFHDNGTVFGLSFSPDSKYLATSTYAHDEIRIWDWRSGHVIKEMKVPNVNKFGGGEAGQTSESVLFNPTKPIIAACLVGYNEGSQGFITTTIWDVDSGAYKQGLIADAVCQGIAFSPDGSRLLETIYNGKREPRVVVYDTDTWQPLWNLRAAKVDAAALGISWDGRFGAIKSSDSEPLPEANRAHSVSRVYVFDLQNGKITGTFDTGTGDGSSFQHLTWNPDNQHIAFGDSTDRQTTKGYTTDVAVKIMDIKTGELVLTQQSGDHEGSLSFLRYTPSGKYLIQGKVSDTVQIWDANHLHLQQEIAVPTSAGAISSDGCYLALGEWRDSNTGILSNIVFGPKVTIWRLK